MAAVSMMQELQAMHLLEEQNSLEIVLYHTLLEDVKVRLPTEGIRRDYFIGKAEEWKTRFKALNESEDAAIKRYIRVQAIAMIVGPFEVLKNRSFQGNPKMDLHITRTLMKSDMRRSPNIVSEDTIVKNIDDTLKEKYQKACDEIIGNLPEGNKFADVKNMPIFLEEWAQ